MFKKILLTLSLVIFCASLPGVYNTNADFNDSAQINNNQFTTGDWTAPYVKIDNPLDGQTVSGTVDIRGTVTDNKPDHYWLAIQQVGSTSYIYAKTVPENTSFTNRSLYIWDTNAASDGDYLIKLEARDAAGNKDPNDSVEWITIHVSNAPSKPTGLKIYKGHDPATRILLGCGGVTNDTHITIEWNQNPENDIDYYWFGTKSNPKHKKITFPAHEYQGNMTPGNNPYYYTVIAVDKTGNDSTISDQCTLTLDQKAPPTPLLISPGNNTQLNSSKLTQTWQQVSDDLGGEVYYDYESYSDAALTNLRYETTYTNSGNGNGLIITKNAQGAPNGSVYWRVKAHDNAGNESAWSQVWHFVVNNTLANPSPDSTTTTPSNIVLNEILPNPLGIDTAAKPDGEWIELYNKSASNVSVAGWHLTDEDGNSMLITGDKTNSSGTDIPGHGFLVVYTGNTALTLDDSGDTVNLYNGIILLDTYTYPSSPEGKSIARIPDGNITWYDPIPTPGEPNQLEENGFLSINTVLHFYLSADKKSVGFKITGISSYENLEYEITYSPANREPQGIIGEIKLDGENELIKEGFILGTDSSEDWIYDTGMTDIYLKVILTGSGMPDRTLEKDLLY